MTTQDALYRLAADLKEAIAQIQAEHKRLAERPTLGTSGALTEASARRDRLVSEIGRVVADALLSGENIAFGEASGEAVSLAAVEAAPAPMPTYSSVPTAPQTRYVARRTAVRAAPRDMVDADALATFIADLGEPDELDTIQQFDQRYQKLRYAASHPNRWIDLPAKAQRHLIGATVALLRDLQEANEEFGRPLREPEIVGLVSRLSHWSKEHRPGWVNGMARGAVPDEGEWLADAQVHLEELQVMVDEARAADRAAYDDDAADEDEADLPEETADDVDEHDPIHRVCPACGAEPGERCKTDSGRTLYSYHHKERR
ncbi:MAG: hypothetical protein EP330_18260 [Deltaproteobacteria bacterium]|nr:MAG: hypothetical protein EP330_18260 [Deltaproteobacteria bacterium]